MANYGNEYRHVSRSENLGGRAVLGGDNVPPLVEIGFTDLLKTEGALAPPAPLLATALHVAFKPLLEDQ